MTYDTPELGYDYDALEPHIDAQTMEIHHDKHHTGYTKKLNAALEGHADLAGRPAEWLLANLDKVPADIRTAVRNNGGGHVNHALFWTFLKKDVKAEGPVVDAITAQWGSLDAFKEKFEQAAATRFGSG